MSDKNPDIRAAGGASISGTFGVAWERFMQRPWELIGLYVLISICSSLNQMGGQVGGGAPAPQGGAEDPQMWIWLALVIGGAIAIGTLFSFLMMFLSVPAKAGGCIYWLRLLRDQDPDFGCALHSLRRLMPLVFTHMLASIFIGLGFVCFIIPGIVLSMGLSMLTFVMIDHDLKYMDAIKATWRLTNGYKMSLFGLSILTSLISLVGVMAMCIGIVVAAPVTAGMWAVAYDRMARPGNLYMDLAEQQEFVSFAV